MIWIWALTMLTVTVLYIVDLIKNPGEKDEKVKEKKDFNLNDFDEFLFNDDDICTDPAYSSFGCNVYNDALFEDDDPFGAGW